MARRQNFSVCLHQKKVDTQSAWARLSAATDERKEEATADTCRAKHLLVLLSPASLLTESAATDTRATWMISNFTDDRLPLLCPPPTITTTTHPPAHDDYTGKTNANLPTLFLSHVRDKSEFCSCELTQHWECVTQCHLQWPVQV